MRIFIDETKRKESQSTCYFELQKGDYAGKCWLKDSIYLSEDVWNRYQMSEMIRSAIPDFDYYGITTVTKEAWEEIVSQSEDSDRNWDEVITEAIPWVEECFKSYDTFTILGM